MKILDTYGRRLITPWTGVFRGALAYATAAQSIVSGAYTAIAFAAESYDTDNIHDNVTNNTRLTVPSGITKVRVAGFGIFASNVTGARAWAFYKNGASFSPGWVESYAQAADDNYGRGFLVSPVLSVVGGDYFELMGYQNSGAALDTYYVAPHICWASMELIE